MTTQPPPDPAQAAADQRRRHALQEIAELRGIALQQFAQLEQNQFMLFAALSGLDMGVAATVFFGINSQHERMKIMVKLYNSKVGAQYQVFWASLQKNIHRLVSQRNNIVHWIVMVELTQQAGQAVERVRLTPPTFWTQQGGRSELAAHDIKLFCRHAYITERCLFYFAMYLRDSTMFQLPGLAGWQQVFAESFSFQLGPNHPLRGLARP